MDEVNRKARNYKIVENLRRENARENRRLQDRFDGRCGFAATHRQKLRDVNKEQQKLKQELRDIKKSTPFTAGTLPDRHDKSYHKALLEAVTAQEEDEDFLLDEERELLELAMRRKEGAHKKAEKYYMETQSKLKEFNTQYPISDEPEQSNAKTWDERQADLTTQRVTEVSPKTSASDPHATSRPPGDVTTRYLSLADVNVSAAKDNVMQRLSHGETSHRPDARHKPDTSQKSDVSHRVKALNLSPRVTRKLCPIDTLKAKAQEQVEMRGEPEVTQHKVPAMAVVTEEVMADMYNPDGSIRTKYTIPDITDSLEEARKARYLRNRYKEKHELELSIKEIFSKEQTILQ